MKSILIIVACLFISTGIYSKSKSDDLFQINAAKTNDPSADYRNSVYEGVILNISKDVYSSLTDNRDQNLEMKIPVSNNNFLNIELERFEILSPDAKITERALLGETQLDLRNIVLSYKGKVKGEGNSLVSISLFNGKVLGLIKSGNETYVIGALKDKNNNETDDHILYKESKMKFQKRFECGSDVFDVPAEVLKSMRDTYGKNSDNMSTNLLEAKVAVDVDFFTYNTYGSSVPNATAYALALMSASSAVYMKDMNIKLTVGYLRVWTVQDPYTSTDGSTLLDQFRSDWSINQGGVERVIAHLLTRRSSINVGGIAFLNALCNMTYGYGLSVLTGTINQLPLYSYDVVVVTHEIGHNFGSPHTHNCSWVGGPIDTCYTIEGGCYSGPSHPAVGTIMSYCDTEGGTVVMNFGPQPGALIRNRAESASCLTTVARPLLVAYPNGGETFRTLSSAVIYWGTSLTGNVNLDYTTNNGTSWIAIQNNVPAQQREFQWTVPYIAYTNQAKVRILNSSNSSEGDTSDASFRVLLTYNPFNVLSPPSTTRIETSANNTSLQQFSWSSAGSQPSLRYKFKIRKVGGGAVDYSYSSNNGGTDTVISIRKSFLDSLALLIGTTGDSLRCTWKSWSYNGYDSASSSNTFLVTLVRTNVGINVISTEVPENPGLYYNYPNPFNPSTVIKFDVSKQQNVSIEIYDMLGRKTESLVNEKLQPGKYEVTFNGTGYPSGIYYYRMQAGDYSETRKMLMVK